MAQFLVLIILYNINLGFEYHRVVLSISDYSWNVYMAFVVPLPP